MSPKKYKAWDRKGPIAKELITNFELFESTNGAAGIDPTIQKPRTIKDIQDKHQFLQPINPQYIANHCLDLSNQWRLNKDCHRSKF